MQYNVTIEANPFKANVIFVWCKRQIGPGTTASRMNLSDMWCYSVKDLSDPHTYRVWFKNQGDCAAFVLAWSEFVTAN